MSWRSNRRIYWSLGLFYLLLFLPLLGAVPLFDWDEVNFAEAAREMLVTGDWLDIQVNYEPFWEKPPLFIWLQALSMKIFGVSAFAARLPNVGIGLITIFLIFHMACRFYGRQAGVLSVLLYVGSITPHLYFKSGIIDPGFNLLIVLGLYQLVRAIQLSNGLRRFLYAGLFLGLAVLTKGPVALLIAGLVGLSYQLIHRHTFYRVRDLFALSLGLLLSTGSWFGLQIWKNGWWFVREFLTYQVELFSQPVASHGQPFYYHALVLLLACFPLTILALPALRMHFNRKVDDLFLTWMRLTFWVVLVLFSAVTTKIVHYSSLCYIPLAILGGEWLARQYRIKGYQKVLLVVVGLGWVLSTTVLILLGGNPEWKQQLLQHFNDPFAAAQLQTAVNWPVSLLFLPAMLLVLITVLVFRYNKANLGSVLIFHVLYLSIFMTQIVPRIEAHTQQAWVTHLSSYAGRPMFHFTQGFKSYAHQYYTRVPLDSAMQSLKREVLVQEGFTDFYSMDREAKQAYEVALRHRVTRQTELEFSLSARITDKAMLDSMPFLREVFSGNGYVVYERKAQP